jgi:hypothetical protein
MIDRSKLLVARGRRHGHARARQRLVPDSRAWRSGDHKKTTIAAQEVITVQVEALERDEKPVE